MPAFDAAVSTNAASSNTLTVAHVIAADANFYISFFCDNINIGSAATITTWTIGGQALTQAPGFGYSPTSDSTYCGIQVGYLFNPPTGSQNLVCAWDGGARIELLGLSYKNVGGIDLAHAGYATAPTNHPQLAIVCPGGGLVVGATVQRLTTSEDIVPDAPGTQRVEEDNPGSPDSRAMAQDSPGAYPTVAFGATWTTVTDQKTVAIPLFGRGTESQVIWMG
jgi:hypothetical protein